MASFATTSGTTIAQTLNGGESGIITFTGSILTSGSVAVTATTGQNWLTNDGNIFAAGGNFSALDVNGSSFALLNDKDGLITAENPASGAIDADLSGSLEITNYGTIHSPNFQAINFETTAPAANLYLTNHGNISVNRGAAILSSPGLGANYISNTGTISGSDNTLWINTADTNSSTHRISNSGTILATTGDTIYVYMGTNDPIFTLNNSGEILAVDYILRFFGYADVDIVNTGLMSSQTSSAGIATDSGNDYLRNSGEIIGSVQTRNGNDTIDSRGGTISGTILTGADNDLVRLDTVLNLVDGGSGNDTLYAQGDLDRVTNFEEIYLVGTGDFSVTDDDSATSITGNSGDNYIFGAGGDDTISGKNGDDELSGGTGNDRIFGGAGQDEIYGFGDADTIRGNTGNDLIDGGSEDDALFGGTGDDTIIGGTGADVMYGDQGADTFVWTAITETGIGAARDVVIGFERGTDVIDLVGIGDTAFTFLGTGAFTGGGGMEARYRVQASGHSIVELDSNGDGVADAEIQVRGVTVLSADDFVL